MSEQIPIKSRAYHRPSDQVVKVLEVDFINKQVLLPIQTTVLDDYWWDETTWTFDDVELMPFTGVCDINENEIYVGDVIQATFEGEEKIGVVNFVHGGYFAVGQVPIHQYTQLKVIGNKFEEEFKIVFK